MDSKNHKILTRKFNDQQSVHKALWKEPVLRSIPIIDRTANTAQPSTDGGHTS
jgi:hypothetical protein